MVVISLREMMAASDSAAARDLRLDDFREGRCWIASLAERQLRTSRRSEMSTIF